MKKPNIGIKEFGAMGPDGYEIVINGKPRYAVRTEAEAKSIIGMIDALIDMKQFIENGVEFEYICLPEEGDSALDTISKINKALKKAGCV